MKNQKPHIYHCRGVYLCGYKDENFRGIALTPFGAWYSWRYDNAIRFGKRGVF